MGLWIDKVGIEVECAVRDRLAIEGFMRTSDGSINSSTGYTAEYVSDPFNYQNLFRNSKYVAASLERCVEKLYGLVTEVNESMGLHIHVSFTNDRNVHRISSMRFYEYFMERLANSDLWSNYQLRSRADGTHYAQKLGGKEVIDAHLHGGGSRYRHINYSALRSHGTVEFRIFPAMETAEEVMKAVEFTTTTINSYLREKRYREAVSKELKEDEVVEDQQPASNSRTVGGNRKVIKEERVASVNGERIEANQSTSGGNPLDMIQQGLKEVRDDV